MKLLLISLSLVMSFHALSLTERGNGGSSLLCTESRKNSFYDSFEAEYRYGLKPNFREVSLEKTRYFNEMVISGRINELNDKDYASLLTLVFF